MAKATPQTIAAGQVCRTPRRPSIINISTSGTNSARMGVWRPTMALTSLCGSAETWAGSRSGWPAHRRTPSKQANNYQPHGADVSDAAVRRYGATAGVRSHGPAGGPMGRAVLWGGGALPVLDAEGGGVQATDGGVQDLGDVGHGQARAAALEAGADLQHAARIGGDQQVGAGGQHA